MLDLIFNLYLKYKKDNSNKIWRRLNRLPKYILVLFLLMIISAISSFVILFLFKNSLLYWIPLAIELLSTVILGFLSEKYFINNSQTEFNERVIECNNMYNKIFKKYSITDEQLHYILNNANNKISEMQNRIDKNHEPLTKLNQALFAPFILIILKAFWDSSNDFSDLIASSVYMIIAYVIIYALIFSVISLMNYDAVRYMNKWKCFANDLQAVIDVTINFKLSENVQLELEEHKTNNEKSLNSNKKAKKNDVK